jgi:hypothetical protein
MRARISLTTIHAVVACATGLAGMTSWLITPARMIMFRRTSSPYLPRAHPYAPQTHRFVLHQAMPQERRPALPSASIRRRQGGQASPVEGRGWMLSTGTTRRRRSCSQSKRAPAGASGMVRPVGFEPTTRGLKGPCSATELRPRCWLWLARVQDSGSSVAHSWQARPPGARHAAHA